MASSQIVGYEIVGPSSAPVARAVSRDLGAPAPAEAVDDTPYSYAFTGRHDGGALPPNASNMYGHVLSAVIELKAAFEVDMVKLIAEGPPKEAPAAKKARVGAGPRRAAAEEEADEGEGGAEEEEEGEGGEI